MHLGYLPDHFMSVLTDGRTLRFRLEVIDGVALLPTQELASESHAPQMGILLLRISTALTLSRKMAVRLIYSWDSLTFYDRFLKAPYTALRRALQGSE